MVFARSPLLQIILFFSIIRRILWKNTFKLYEHFTLPQTSLYLSVCLSLDSGTSFFFFFFKHCDLSCSVSPMNWLPSVLTAPGLLVGFLTTSVSEPSRST